MKNNARILFTQQDIKEKVQSLAKDIAKDIQGEDLLAISLLRGSFIFAADLIREISNYTDKKIEIDFITTSSYGDEEKSVGIVDIISDVRSQVRGRNILIIDDILDSGYTMNYVQNHLREKNPLSIKTVTLLDKPSRRKVDIKSDYVGFVIDDLFIVGYGLNYGKYYRNIPYIYCYEWKNKKI